MNIAINTRFLLPGYLEGFGWYTHELVRRMVQAHPNDQFILLFDRPFEDRYVYGPNVIPVVAPPQARFAPLFYAWFEWSVPRALKKYGAEVFFSPDSMCSLSSKVRTVMTCHDLAPLHHAHQIQWIHRHYHRHFLPKYLRRADQVVTVSDYVRHDIHQTCHIPLDKISVIYNGCREGFQPLDETAKTAVRAQFAAGKPYFLYTGAIHPRKNIPRLIEAFDRFKTKTGAPDKLLLGGRFAWKTGDVLHTYENARHKADIRFTDYVPENDLYRLMGAATALTYPSLSEGFGLPMLEAMYCDTPVLAANATCLPEIAGDAALLVNPLSVDEMAGGLEKLWRDASLRQQLVENGRKQRQKFSWDLAAQDLYALIRTA